MLVSIFAITVSCSPKATTLKNPAFTYTAYKPTRTETIISREQFYEKLQGFWLGTCIANWTDLVTDMDQVGTIGETKTGDFYTRQDWRKPDQPSVWGKGIPSNLSPTIDFVVADVDSTWGLTMTRILSISTRNCEA